MAASFPLRETKPLQPNFFGPVRLDTTFEESEQMDGLSALHRIKEGFDAEFASPTDDPSGEILP